MRAVSGEVVLAHQAIVAALPFLVPTLVITLMVVVMAVRDRGDHIQDSDDAQNVAPG